MASGWASRWPLRARVAVAFLLTTALALVALGVFVQVRVADTLDERLRDSLEAEAERLAGMTPEQRQAAVASLTGETFAQVLTDDGEVVASSPQLTGPPLTAGPADRDDTDEEVGEDGYVEADVSVLDDEPDPDEGDATETEAALLLVRRAGDQLVVVGTSRDDTAEAAAEVRTQLLVGGPVALVVAGGLGYLVAGAGLRPIERMRARAATISDRSAGERLPVPEADDELRRLATTLNAMLDRLDEGLQRQRRFVAEASHELRTPLALMVTELELALARPRTPEELVAALRSTQEETRRLVALAEDLLLLAAADSGGLSISPRTVDLTGLAGEVVDRFRPAAEAGGRAIGVTGPEPSAVSGDPDRLDQVLSNLVDNALRHGAGPVEVSVMPTGGSVRLVVSDRGPGFGEQRPFDRFAGAGGSTGLGLAIVREIVLAHGGSVEISRTDGRTDVVVTLPAPTLGA